MQRIVQCDICFSSSLCIFISGPTYTLDHTLESRYVKSKIKFKKNQVFSGNKNPSVPQAYDKILFQIIELTVVAPCATS